MEHGDASLYAAHAGQYWKSSGQDGICKTCQPYTGAPEVRECILQQGAELQVVKQ